MRQKAWCDGEACKFFDRMDLSMPEAALQAADPFRKAYIRSSNSPVFQMQLQKGIWTSTSAPRLRKPFGIAAAIWFDWQLLELPMYC
jgi:hypothetical protein